MLIHRDLFFVIIAILATFVVYSDSFNNSFVWDDYCFVVQNPAIRDLTFDTIRSYFTDYRTSSNTESLSRDVYRPLVTTSFSVDYRLWGLNPHLYHIESTVLHVVNVFLVYIVIRLITDSSPAALIASLVFGIHPAQTEAVTWISGRSNMLFLLFYLAAFIAHLRRAREASRQKFGLPLVLFTASLFVKEMAITAPLIMLAYDLHCVPRKRLRDYLEYYAPFFLLVVCYLIARWVVVGGIVQGEGYRGGTFLENLLTTCKAAAGYVRLLVFPVNLRADYQIEISKSIAEPDTAVAIVALLVIALLYLVLVRARYMRAAFFIMWFFVALSPVSNIVPFKAILAERLLYLPLIGFSGLLALGATKLYKRAPLVTVLAMSALTVFYGAATMARNMDWRDEVSLYTKDLAKTPESARFHYNLALAYSRQYLFGRSKEIGSAELKPYYLRVKRELEETIRLRPDHIDAYLNLGNIYNNLGEREKAIECFKRILAIEENPNAYNNLGIVYYNSGLYDDAISCYKKALVLPWKTPELGYSNLGNAYFKKKDYKRAKEAWRQVLRLNPENKSVQQNVANLEKLGY